MTAEREAPASAQKTRILIDPNLLWFGFLGVLFILVATEDLWLALARVAGLFGAASALVLHEVAHAIAARALGLRVVSIEFRALFGAARMQSPRTPKEEWLVAAAGPAANLAVAGLGLACAGWSVRIEATEPPFLLLLTTSHLLMGSLNLLPFYPMDGGRILRAALWSYLGRERASKIALQVGAAAALSGLLLPWATGFALWSWAIVPASLLLFALNRAEARRLRAVLEAER